MDSKDFEILGIKPDATVQEIKKRYDLLMRRSIHDESFDIDSVTKAYDRIMAGDTIEKPDAGLVKTKDRKNRKFKNFMSRIKGKTD